MKLTQFFNSCHENDQLLIYFFLNFRIFFALFTENNANLTPTRDDVTHPRDSWHYEPDSVWPCGISNLENLTPNPQFEDVLCCAQTAHAATLTRRRRFRNGAKTHRQVSDATAMMRPMMNIRPAVSGVMNYLVYVANLRVLVRNQIGHCWLARSPPRSEASLPDRTFKIK